MPVGVVYNVSSNQKKKQCELIIGAIIGYMFYKQKIYVLKKSTADLSIPDSDINLSDLFFKK